MKKNWFFTIFLFLLPIGLTSASLWGPLSGSTVFLICLFLFFVIMILESSRLLKIRSSTLILLCGITLSMCIVTFVMERSPEAKSRRAQEEAERQKIIKSQTLLDKEPMEEIQATVLNSPEFVDDYGSLMVMRFQFDGKRNFPRMAFIDRSKCHGLNFILPRPNDKIDIKIRRFRAEQHVTWRANPESGIGSYLYFAEPTCR